MAVTFDGSNKLIICESGTLSLDIRDMYSRWKDWTVQGDNAKFLPAFRVVGGDPIDETKGIFVTGYFFLLNGWRIRPQEANHKLTVANGILVVDGGGDPFVHTLGNYNVMVQYSQPIKSETVSTAGAVAVGMTDEQATMLLEIYKLMGLDPTKPLIVTETGRSVSTDIIQTFETDDTNKITVVTRQ